MWIRKNSNSAHYHRGADAGKDADHSTQKGSGNRVGRGSEEVGTPMYPEGFKDPWEYPTTLIGFKPRGRRIPDKP